MTAMFITGRRLDDHLRECGQRHNEMLDRIKDLLDQTRGEFKATRDEFRAIREETEKRHTENRKQAWAVALVILGAVATSYLAQHGFSAPALDPMVSHAPARR